MVHFRADKAHFSKSMHVMNDLRKNGTFCDISLVVGSQVLKAHRCVLAAGSSYFNALFLGQFAEASMSEINLSKVTKDISILEMMVNCLYTGEIDIDADNLDTVVKLSSYFIMETVLEFCDTFIVDTLSLQNCLKYHQCAIKHGLTDIMEQTTPMVKTRFHDSIIFEEETLNISPKELVYLHENEVFQFCTPPEVLKFVVDWVKRGLTEQHIAVGTEILDSVGCIKDPAARLTLPMSLMHSTEETLHTACEEMLSALSETILANHEEFISSVSKLRNECIADTKRRYNLRVLPTAKTPSTSIDDMDKEHVLVTLSPRQCVIDNLNRSPSKQNHTRPYADPVFDVCVYVPSLRCWYYLESIDDEDLYTDELKLGALLDKTHDDWVFSMRSDQLVFAYMKDTDEHQQDIDVNDMTLYRLNSTVNSTWISEFSFGDEVEECMQVNESWERNRFCVVTGLDNTMYMITVINSHTVENGQNNEYILFRGFKFLDTTDDTDSDLWEVFFQTEKYHLTEGDFKGGDKHELHASVSSVSNEMLVTYCDKGGEYRSIVFVVDLGSETPVPVSIWDLGEYKRDLDALGDRHVRIVQGKEQFFILFDILQTEDGHVYVEEAERFIRVKSEVKYHSNKLTALDTCKEMLGESDVIQPEEGHSESHRISMPCMMELIISGRESMWYICGDKGLVSRLTEVTVSDKRTPVIKAHPPPPFTCVTAAFAGTVSQDVLKKLEPVSFLGRNTP